MANPFRTPNLILRAIESPDDDSLFLRIQQTPQDFANSNARVQKPQSRADATRYQKDVTENALLGLALCLPDTSDPNKPGTAVGVIHLSGLPPHLSHHRFTEIGIDILTDYQGKGYGSEAIRWVLEWAFENAGLHRVVIQAFEYNEGARRLYERLGFRHEGTIKEALWSQGRWWDNYKYGMLEGEWRALREEEGKR